MATKDNGEDLDDNETFGGYNRYTVNSALQKAVRRSDEDVATWAAWELARSGYGWNAWDRMTLYIIEDLAAGEEIAIKLRHLERAAMDANMDSVTGQIAAIKAARLCVDAWSSREATHAQDYFSEVASLRAENDDPKYDFPVDGTPLDDSLEERESGGQMTFGDGGLSSDTPTNDFGNELRKKETYGGFHNDGLLKRLKSAIANKETEVAAFIGFELARSGYASKFWSKIPELAVKYAKYDSSVLGLIDRYEALATNKWDDSDWEGQLCAIHAAITAIRGPRDETDIDLSDTLKEAAQKRVEGKAQFPVEPDELEVGEKYGVCLDKHTRPGKMAGREWTHFWTRAARVGPEGEPELSEKWQKRRLELYGIDAEDILHALTPVSETDRWYDQ